MKTSSLKFLLLAVALGYGALNPRQAAAQNPCCPPGTTPGPDLVINPDFSAGNTGFTSDYLLLSPTCSPGFYTVATSLTVGGMCNNWACIDHTAGSPTGNFFVADGSQTTGQAAWRQQVNLTPSTQYAFCAWVNNLNEPTFDRADPIVEVWLVPASGPAVLLTSSGLLPESPDNWVQISAGWSSPSVVSNPYQLEFRTASTSFEGNNFAIDDISFRACSTTPPCVNCPPLNETVIGCPPVVPDYTTLNYCAPPNGPLTVTQNPPAGTVLPPGQTVVVVRICDALGQCRDCDVIIQAVYLPGCSSCCPVGATPGPDLVINPDFSAGNTGFTSDYLLLSPTCSPGLHNVATSLTVGGMCNNWACIDHTTGSPTGNFFVADGSQTIGQAAWRQQVNLTPSTQYEFCAWINNLNEPTFNRADPIVEVWLVPASGPAVLLTSSGALPESPDNWVQISAGWFSPAVVSNPYQLEFRTASTSFEGNNFAIDDISFRACEPVCLPSPANMVLWLPFDTSGPSAQNLAGGPSGVHFNWPTFNPGSYVANSLCFDGVDDYVEVVNHPAIGFGTNDFTVDAWVKPATLDSTVRIIVDHRESSANGVIGYSLFLGGNNGIGFQIGDGNSFINYPSSLSVPVDGQWHLVAVTVKRNDAQGIHFYLDGVQQVLGRDTIPFPGSVTPAANFPLRVGARSFSPDGIFNGCIDEVELFNRELTAAEVQALYNAGSAGKCKPVCILSPSSMVLWLPLDTSGPSAQNLAGGANGVHFNAPTFNPGSYVANSLCFDGVDDYVEVVNHPAIGFGTNDFTVDAWVKPATLDSTVRIIVDHRESSANGVIGYSLFLGGNNSIGFQIGDGNSFINYPSSLSVPADGRWHLVAVTVKRNDAQGIHFYVDGVQQVLGRDTIPFPGSVTPAANFPLRVGARSFSPDGIFNGCIDEVELFNRELTAAEVQALYNAGSAGKCKANPCPLCPIILDPPQLTNTNTLILSWSGVDPSQSVTVEASTNLIDWTVVAMAPAGTNQVELLLDPEEPASFFRLRGPAMP